MRKTLGIDFRDLAQVFLRPIAASAAMFWIVRLFVQQLSVLDDAAVQIPLLIMAIGIGTIAYAGINFTLWSLAGRPTGPESFVIARIRKLLPG